MTILMSKFLPGTYGVFQGRVKKIINLRKKTKDCCFHNILLLPSFVHVTERGFLIYSPGLSNTDAILKQNTEQEFHQGMSGHSTIFVVVIRKPERYRDIPCRYCGFGPRPPSKVNIEIK